MIHADHFLLASHAVANLPRAGKSKTRQIVAFVFRNPRQTVSFISNEVQLPLPVSSNYLRSLEARGILTVQRIANRVKCSPATGETATSKNLVIALRKIFWSKNEAVDMIFKTVTAFTHPRRVEIYRALQSGGLSFEQLRNRTNISTPALRRHLNKLKSRAFVVLESNRYIPRQRTDALAQELARMAMNKQAD
jgi:predicted transcriptional regulator